MKRKLSRRIESLRERMREVDIEGGDTYAIEDEIERLETKLRRIKRWGPFLAVSSGFITLCLIGFGIYSVVHNVSPVASFTSPTQCTTGEPVVLNAAASYDRDGSIRSYKWRIGNEVILEGKRATHTFTRTGRYNVYLTVEDNRGESDTSHRVITVESPNQLPVARFSYSPSAPNLATTVYFDASDSSDADGSVESYRWEFSDSQQTRSSRHVSHRFENPGVHTVRLYVTDDRGGEDTVTRMIIVVNERPTAGFTVSEVNPGINERIRFDASPSQDRDGEIVSYVWRFGDGSTSQGKIVYHSYGSAGTRNVTLEVIDNRGAKAQFTRRLTIEPPNQRPTAMITIVGPAGPDSIFAEGSITFLGLLSRDPDGNIMRYEWRLSDGNTSEGIGWLHILQRRGTYTITLTVTDDDGATHTTNRQFRY